MSILASLKHAYDRLSKQDEGMPPFGFSTQNIHCCIVLDTAGMQVGPPVSWHKDDSGKPSARSVNVPYFGGRSGSKAPPYFLWDNTAYVLGASEKDNFDAGKRFLDFKNFHLKHLSGENDIGLIALRHFLNQWNPSRYKQAGFADELKGKNVIFRIIGDDIFIHQRESAIALWNRIYKPDVIGEGVCLISGNRTRIARLHPPIVSFENPARIVSFDRDNDAFSSYGHVQAENAPTGIESAFAYTATLNRFLSRNGTNCIKIGEISTVFWAHASDFDAAKEAESIFSALLDEPDEKTETDRIGEKLERIRKGVPLEDIEPKLSKGVRFYVLGLSPSTARLSIRFWFEDDFGVLTKNYQNYVADLRFEPLPKSRPATTVRSLVLRTAPARRDRSNQIKFDANQISPLLAGELLRAILTGRRFPGSLLSTLIMRIRSDHLLDSIRVSLIKAIVVRTMRAENRLPETESGLPKEDYLVRSDPDDPNSARRLGRLFAVLERTQLAALGDEINATIKDKFLGAAAATPQQVFPGLIKLSQHHLKRLRNGHSDATWIKDALHARRVSAGLEQDIGKLWSTFDDGSPAQHSTEEQGLFFVGYYQERFGKADANSATKSENAVQSNDNEE